MASPVQDWICDCLKSHLSPHQLKQAETFLHAESWISAAAIKRQFDTIPEEVPLRFRLDIDVSE